MATATHPTYGPHPPVSVERAAMRMRWSTLTFLHWSYDADVVQTLLPPGLTVETYDDRAWVGLIPFEMTVAPSVGPAVPWLSHFPETNVRTYVRADDGTTGIWFFSLDAGRLAAVTAARASWGLPYYWSAMHVERRVDRVGYRSARRRTPRPAVLSAYVDAAAPIPAAELTNFDHYLTARFVLFAQYLGRLWYTRAEHPPWLLRRAVVHSVRGNLLEAAGLPPPTGDPVAHFSDGVEVRVGLPHLVG